MHPKPVHDSLLLNHILDNIVKLIDLNNRKTNQADIYKFDFINQTILNKDVCKTENLEINLVKFENNQIKGTKYLREGIFQDISNFKRNIGSIYQYSLLNSSGAVLWNYFNETLNVSGIYKEANNISPQPRKEEDPIILKQYKNVVVLFTDGYIENANKTRGYVVDSKLIVKSERISLIVERKIYVILLYRI